MRAASAALFILPSVIRGEHLHNILEGRGEFTLAFIPDSGRGVGNVHGAFSEQLGGLPDAVMLHIRSDRKPVYGLEDIFKSGGIDQILPGKLFYCIPAAEILRDLGMDPADGLGLTGVIRIERLRFGGLGHFEEQEELLAFELQIGQDHSLRKIIHLGKNMLNVSARGKGSRFPFPAEFLAE